MNYNVYAIIDDDGFVEELRIFDSQTQADIHVNSIYADGKAILVNDYKLKLRDVYKDGKFYRQQDGELILINHSYDFEANRLKNLDSIIESLKQRIKYLEEKYQV